ncbi:MAG TPA: hypothetical protein VGM44_05595 [Polyangiaceae bacterium]|jgi:hypothetical protein
MATAVFIRLTFCASSNRAATIGGCLSNSTRTFTSAVRGHKSVSAQVELAVENECGSPRVVFRAFVAPFKLVILAQAFGNAASTGSHQQLETQLQAAKPMRSA